MINWGHKTEFLFLKCFTKYLFLHFIFSKYAPCPKWHPTWKATWAALFLKTLNPFIWHLLRKYKCVILSNATWVDTHQNYT